MKPDSTEHHAAASGRGLRGICGSCRGGLPGPDDELLYINDTVQMGLDDTCPSAVLLRFPAVVIPQGAHILTASVRFRAVETTTRKSLVLRIRAEDTADAPRLWRAAAASLPAEMPMGERGALTDAEVIWEVPRWTEGEEGDSADIALVLQVRKPTRSLDRRHAVARATVHQMVVPISTGACRPVGLGRRGGDDSAGALPRQRVPIGRGCGRPRPGAACALDGGG